MHSSARLYRGVNTNIFGWCVIDNLIFVVVVKL